MYTYIHTYIHTLTFHVYIHTYIHTCIHTHIHTEMCILYVYKIYVSFPQHLENNPEAELGGSKFSSWSQSKNTRVSVFLLIKILEVEA